MIKIFYCNSNNPNIPLEISDYRKEKIASSDIDKQGTINSARVLCAGFAALGISEKNVTYGVGDHGKPYAENFSHVHFSLAHCKNMAIVAFHDKEIGIDCEKSDRKISSEILTRFFKESECKDFTESPITLWCAKEAFVKYTGRGFATGRKECTMPFFCDEVCCDGAWFKRFTIDGHECVVCTSQPESVEIIRV